VHSFNFAHPNPVSGQIFFGRKRKNFYPTKSIELHYQLINNWLAQLVLTTPYLVAATKSYSAAARLHQQQLRIIVSTLLALYKVTVQPIFILLHPVSLRVSDAFIIH